jgi:hypothetical protein
MHFCSLGKLEADHWNSLLVRTWMDHSLGYSASWSVIVSTHGSGPSHFISEKLCYNSTSD